MVTTIESLYPAEILWNMRQRLHVNLMAPSFSGLLGDAVTLPPSYIRNDYFLCKSMNEVRATGTYTRSRLLIYEESENTK